MAKGAVEIKGLQKTTKALSAVSSKMDKAIAAAVNSEAQLILTEAKVLVPYITGNLRDTARVTPAKIMPGMPIFAIIEFIARYALRVHEEPRPPSSNGTFKYLETPLKDASADYPQRVARRAAEIFDRGAGGEDG